MKASSKPPSKPAGPQVTLKQLDEGWLYGRETGRGKVEVWMGEDGIVIAWKPYNCFAKISPGMVHHWKGRTLGRAMRYVAGLAGNPPTAKHSWRRRDGQEGA